MSSRFLDIPNEKIVEDYKRYNLIPTCGEYYRNSYMGKEGDYCCPITCQVIAGGKVSLKNLKQEESKSQFLSDKSKITWPDLAIYNSHGNNMAAAFISGFDSDQSSSLWMNKEYFEKGRELRKLLFNNDAGVVS